MAAYMKPLLHGNMLMAVYVKPLLHVDGSVHEATIALLMAVYMKPLLHYWEDVDGSVHEATIAREHVDGSVKPLLPGTC